MSDEKRTTSVTPGPGQLETVAKELLRLADSPEDVVYRSRGGHFDVPEELAVKYAAQTVDELAAAAEPGEQSEKKPRARKRAPKAAAEAKPAAAEKPARRQRASSAGKSTTPETSNAKAKRTRGKSKGGDK